MYVLSHPVGVLPDYLKGFISILPVDLHALVGAYIEFLKCHHYLPNLPLLVKGFHDDPELFLSYSFNLQEPFRIVLDYIKRFLTKPFHYSRGGFWPNVWNKS